MDNKNYYKLKSNVTDQVLENISAQGEKHSIFEKSEDLWVGPPDYTGFVYYSESGIGVPESFVELAENLKTIQTTIHEQDMVNKPKHYQLFPEHNLEVKDINKRILDNMESSGFNITLYEAGWYQQAMQYFERCYLKNGLEDLEKGIVTMQFVVDSMKERLKNE